MPVASVQGLKTKFIFHCQEEKINGHSKEGEEDKEKTDTPSPVKKEKEGKEKENEDEKKAEKKEEKKKEDHKSRDEKVMYIFRHVTNSILRDLGPNLRYLKGLNGRGK